RGLDGFPLQFLQAALVAGIDTGLTARALERALLVAADEHRNVVMQALSTAFRSEQRITDEVVLASGSLRRAAADQEPIGTVAVGPASLGVIVRFTPAEGAIQAGYRAAPYACALLGFTDREYGTDFGPCSPAPDVR
ncbi:MAG: hypothetical protein H0T54_03110, partial [Geodermatophilaceae bacterium]|nr:hypothetical protein [Geodermatophilaceae bacterium]